MFCNLNGGAECNENKCICTFCQNDNCDVYTECDHKHTFITKLGECEDWIGSYESIIDYFLDNDKIVKQCNLFLIKEIEYFRNKNYELNNKLSKLESKEYAYEEIKKDNDKFLKDKEDEIRALEIKHKIDQNSMQDKLDDQSKFIKKLENDLDKYKPKEYKQNEHGRFSALELE